MCADLRNASLSSLPRASFPSERRPSAEIRPPSTSDPFTGPGKSALPSYRTFASQCSACVLTLSLTRIISTPRKLTKSHLLPWGGPQPAIAQLWGYSMIALLMKAPIQTGFFGFGRRDTGAGGRLSTSIAAAAEAPSLAREGPAELEDELGPGPAPFE